MDTLDNLPDEGKAVVRVTRSDRRECEECGEPAHFKHTWLLSGTRRNPASRAFGRDDCSWCEDDCTYTCRECSNKTRPPEGYVTCSTFPASERFAHMFLYQADVKLGSEMADAFDKLLSKL